MAKETLVRPDKNLVKEQIKQAKRIDTGLQYIVSAHETAQHGATEAAQALYNHRLQRTLEEMDIEQLNIPSCVRSDGNLKAKIAKIKIRE